jgi:hypothetical protein
MIMNGRPHPNSWGPQHKKSERLPSLWLLFVCLCVLVHMYSSMCLLRCFVRMHAASMLVYLCVLIYLCMYPVCFSVWVYVGRGRELPPVRWMFDFYCALSGGKRELGNQPNCRLFQRPNAQRCAICSAAGASMQ